MSDQPEALRLADTLELDPMPMGWCDEAAAELRRLHQFAEDQIGRATAAEAALQMTKATHALTMYEALKAQRDALLEALKRYVDHFGDPLKCARAAIAKAEEA